MLLTAFKPHHFFALCVPHLGKLIKKQLLPLLWCPWEVQSSQSLSMQGTLDLYHTPIPNTINPKKVSSLCSLKSYSDQQVATLLRKLLYMCNKIFHTLKKLIHNVASSVLTSQTKYRWRNLSQVCRMTITMWQFEWDACNKDYGGSDELGDNANE